MIQIKVNTKVVHKVMMDMEAKHVKFALSRAMNKTAQDAQRDLREDLPNAFIIRKPFLRNRLQVDFSSKKNLRTTVGFRTGQGGRTDWIVNQVDGGTKRPARQQLAIPVGVKKNKRDLIAKANKPKALLARRLAKGADVFIAKSKRGKLGIWEHSGREGDPLKLLYVFKPMVQIKKRFRLEAITDKAIASKFNGHFQAEFLAALKS